MACSSDRCLSFDVFPERRALSRLGRCGRRALPDRPSGFLQRSQDGRISDSLDSGVRGVVERDEGCAVDGCAGP